MLNVLRDVYFENSRGLSRPPLDPHLIIDIKYRHTGYLSEYVIVQSSIANSHVHVTGGDIDSLFNVNDIKIKTEHTIFILLLIPITFQSA